MAREDIWVNNDLPIRVSATERIRAVDTGQDTRGQLLAHLISLGFSLSRALALGILLTVFALWFSFLARLGGLVWLQDRHKHREVDIQELHGNTLLFGAENGLVERDDRVVLGVLALTRSEQQFLHSLDNQGLHHGVCLLQLQKKVRCARGNLLSWVTEFVDQQPQQVRLLLRLFLQKLVDVTDSTRPGELNFIITPNLENLQDLKELLLNKVLKGPHHQVALLQSTGEGVALGPAAASTLERSNKRGLVGERLKATITGQKSSLSEHILQGAKNLDCLSTAALASQANQRLQRLDVVQWRLLDGKGQGRDLIAQGTGGHDGGVEFVG